MSGIEFVFDLFLENKGRIENSQLQKFAYQKAQMIRHSLLETFTKSYFGMHSSQISNLVQTLRACGFIDTKIFRKNGRIITRYYLTDDALFLPRNMEHFMEE